MAEEDRFLRKSLAPQKGSKASADNFMRVAACFATLYALMSFSGVNFTGLASGIDTDSIIRQLLALEARPIRRLQAQQAELRQKLSATDRYRSLIQALRSAAAELNRSATFRAVRGSSSDATVATVSAGEGAMPGVYTLSVSRLAQAHKVATIARTDATSSLNLSGTFLVNGKAVVVDTNDSLSSIASKINSLNSGVTASILNGGVGNVFLTITANDTGALNSIALSDVGGGVVLESLGLVAGGTSIRRPIANGAESLRFADSVTAIGTLLNVNVPSGDIQINGVNISVDLSQDSLSDLAARINASPAGVTATVVTEEIGETTYYKLQITGASTPTFTDAHNILQSLGILQRGYGNELLSAQDAQFTLDTVSLTSSSNTVTGVIPGATITLLRADAGSPPTTTIRLAQDTDAVRNKVQAFADAYNAIVDFLKSAAFFDSETLATGPLFGDSAVDVLQQQVLSALLGSPAGVIGGSRNLLAIGINFGADGKMTIDAGTFDSAIRMNIDNVVGLFAQVGRFVDSAGQGLNDPNLRFVSAGPKAKPSGLVGYLVTITQLATKASHTAGTAFTSPSSQTETLTFGGPLLGNQTYNLTIPANTTLDELISLINTDSRLKNLIEASKTSENKLVLTSKVYGSPGNFTVVSSLPAGNDNSGIGDTEISVMGQDVGGTINGEPATGRGQFLTGNEGNATTEGITLMVMGGALGDRGYLIYSEGAATVIQEVLDSALDTINGLLPVSVNTIQDQ
ncbi:MAG: flagellar filament capping protein FliD, partial [Candidatus Caldarchaeum sp.]